MAFHVLTEKAVPDYLFSGHSTSRINGRYEPIVSDSNNVMCGADVGNRREAITYKQFMHYANNGKLRVQNMCSACAKRLGIHKQRRKDDGAN